MDKRGKPKRKREKLPPGLRGVKASDRFTVEWLEPNGRLKQERIKLEGKPGKRLADRRAEQVSSQLVLGEYESKESTTWPEFRKERSSTHTPEAFSRQ